MLYGKYPYEGMSDYDILRKIKKDRPDYKNVQISAISRDFLDKCLTIDPEKRISWVDLYEHTLIAKSDEHLMYNLKSRINIKDNKSFYRESILKQ
jgi:serine/threonine protein kinase